MAFTKTSVKTTHPNEAEHRRELASGLQNILDGKINTVGTITLTASATTTNITASQIGADTIAVLVPTTANASAEIGAGTIYQTYANAANGTIVINHANNSQSDRTFVYILFG